MYQAYIEALKQTLNDLTEQRDATKREDELKSQREFQNRLVRFQVLQAFLNLLRNSNDNIEYARWAAILEENFVLSVPTIVEGSDSVAEKMLSGVAEVRNSLSAGFMPSFFQNKAVSTSVDVNYHCDRETLLMDGSNCVLDWSGDLSFGEGNSVSVNRERGAISMSVLLSVLASFCAYRNFALSMGQQNNAKILVTGTLRAQFNNDTNKLRSVRLVFDSGTLRRQLKKHNI